MAHDDVKTTEKDDALRLAVSQLASEFSKESMLSLHKFFGVRRAQVISTGSLKLDLALGIGGLPKVTIGLVQLPFRQFYGVRMCYTTTKIGIRITCLQFAGD